MFSLAVACHYTTYSVYLVPEEEEGSWYHSALYSLVLFVHAFQTNMPYFWYFRANSFFVSLYVVCVQS